MKRTFILAFSFLLLLTCDAFAKTWQDGHISITAQSISYNKPRNMIEAVGSVVINGKDFKISSSYAKYYPLNKNIIVEEQFLMEIEAYKISGSRLEYNAATGIGNVLIVRINFGQTFLGGSFMRMEEDQYNILNAYFTGCNRPDSDYHGSSNEIVFYPRTGLLVGYWGTFWIGSTPTVPLPTLVYSAPVPKKPKVKSAVLGPPKNEKRQIERKRDVFPRPGLGFNTEDGYFLVQPFDAYPGPKSYMRTFLSWSEKKNLGLAVAANYILWNDRNEGEVRIGTTSEDKNFGGITHFMSFGPKLLTKEQRDKYVYDKYFPGNKYLIEGEINYSLRERIHLFKNEGPFGRVSFLPKVTLRANRNFILDNEYFTYYAETNWALVTEESTGVGGQREEAKADVTFDYPLWFLGNFSAKSQIDLIGYMEDPLDILGNSYWNSATQDMSLTQNWGDILETGIGNTHIYFNNGSTPYEFEGYWFSPYDTLKLFTRLNFFSNSLAWNGRYDLPSQEWRSLTYDLTIGMHCYDIVASYGLFKDSFGENWTEFTMSASLTPSKW